jgi:5-methylcytosine-specific restriction endonuclease McrA
VTLGADDYTKLRRAQDLMRHTIPDGDVSRIVRRALTVLVDRLERTTIARVSRPRARTTPSGTRNRHIPAPLKRDVWVRDGGRCAFVGSHGRCTETGGLEFHHLIPFAQGGATDVSNISLRSRAHNSFESEEVFGRWLRPTSPRVTRSGPS